MKIKLIKNRRSACVLLLLGLMAMSPAAWAKDYTAFQLVKEGDHYIGDQSKDKVVQIRSEKSVATLTPDIWYVVYYDPDATLKAVQVKFGAGEKMDVDRPVRLLEPLVNADEPLAVDDLKVDSDQALDIAKKDPLLANLTLRASQMTLERHDRDDATPIWKVHFWAAKLSDPNDDADIGEMIISAGDGTVLKNDLKPANVN